MGWLLAVNPSSVGRRRIRGKRRKEEEEKGEEEGGGSKSLISSGCRSAPDFNALCCTNDVRLGMAFVLRDTHSKSRLKTHTMRQDHWSKKYRREK